MNVVLKRLVGSVVPAFAFCSVRSVRRSGPDKVHLSFVQKMQTPYTPGLLVHPLEEERGNPEARGSSAHASMAQPHHRTVEVTTGCPTWQRSKKEKRISTTWVGGSRLALTGPALPAQHQRYKNKALHASTAERLVVTIFLLYKHQGTKKPSSG